MADKIVLLDSGNPVIARMQREIQDLWYVLDSRSWCHSDVYNFRMQVATAQTNATPASDSDYNNTNLTNDYGILRPILGTWISVSDRQLVYHVTKPTQVYLVINQLVLAPSDEVSDPVLASWV
jgi:hypothetical protein